MPESLKYIEENIEKMLKIIGPQNDLQLYNSSGREKKN